MYFLYRDNDYYTINSGVENTLDLLKVLDNFSHSTANLTPCQAPAEFQLTIRETLEHADFAFIRSWFEEKNLSAIDIARLDYLFRYLGYGRLKVLLDIVYQLDVFTAASLTCKTLGFSFSRCKQNRGANTKARGLFHPFFGQPVPNDVEFKTLNKTSVLLQVLIWLVNQLF